MLKFYLLLNFMFNIYAQQGNLGLFFKIQAHKLWGCFVCFFSLSLMKGKFLLCDFGKMWKEDCPLFLSSPLPSDSSFLFRSPSICCLFLTLSLEGGSVVPTPSFLYILSLETLFLLDLLMERWQSIVCKM